MTTFMPITVTALDGTVVEWFVTAGGGTSQRIVTPDGTEFVVDLTEAQAATALAEVEAQRRAAA